MTQERPEPRWVSKTVVLAVQADQIRQHGGALGLRDEGLLESALERPRHRWLYDDDVDLCGLAAAYGFGLAGNHAFIDGNKRVAFQAMYVFLGLNGLRIEAPESAVIDVMLGVAAGQVDETALGEWLRANTQPRQ